MGAAAALYGAIQAGGGGGGGSASQIADPYQDFRRASGQRLSDAANSNVYGGGVSGPSTIAGLSDYVQNNTMGQTNSLNGIGNQLANLVKNPDSVYQSQQYQSQLAQGLSAANAGLGAQGLNGSGNQMAALQNVGQATASNAYNTQLSQLSGLYSQSLQANQQGFNQASGLNAQSYNQLAQMSGAGSGSMASAAQQLASAGSATSALGSQFGQSLYQGVSGMGSNGYAQGSANYNGFMNNADANGFGNAFRASSSDPAYG